MLVTDIGNSLCWVQVLDALARSLIFPSHNVFASSLKSCRIHSLVVIRIRRSIVTAVIIRFKIGHVQLELFLVIFHSEFSSNLELKSLFYDFRNNGVAERHSMTSIENLEWFLDLSFTSV